MNINDFRQLFAATVAEPLAAHGFVPHGDSLFCTLDEATVALLRVRTKYSNVAQEADYLVAIRHDFLPSIEGKLFDGPVDDALNYPFRFHPLEMARCFLVPGMTLVPRVRYRSGTPAESDCLRIRYAEEDPAPKLSLLRQNTTKYALALARHLTPQVAAAQIREHGEDWYLERVWLQAYGSAGAA